VYFALLGEDLKLELDDLKLEPDDLKLEPDDFASRVQIVSAAMSNVFNSVFIMCVFVYVLVFV
jgi:hypothetical protein